MRVTATLDPVQMLLDLLPEHRKSGNGFIARCPAHDDGKPSLSIGRGDGGMALVYCQAGCSTAAICAALGITVNDLFPPRDNHNGHRNGTHNGHGRPNGTVAHKASPNGQPKKIAATYDYVGPEGELLYQKVRYDPKDFRQRRPDGNGGWIYNLGEVHRVLYRQPELNDADHDEWVHLVEGEKAADALIAAGLVATCTCEGAGKWKPVYTEALRGRRVAVLVDNDDAGRAHGRLVAGQLTGTAAEVRVVELPGLPEKGDAYDYLEAGHAAEELTAIVEAAKPWSGDKNPGNAGKYLFTSANRGSENRKPKVAAGPFVPFPIEELPSPLREYVENAAATIGCDPSYIALPLLAACGQAIGTARRCKLKRGWYEPPIIWTAIVGDSGSLKTPAIEAATRHPKKFQEAAYAAHAKDMAQHADEVKAWKALPKDARGTEPAEPDGCHRIVLGEATIEAAIDRLSNAPRGLILVRDELAGWLGSFNQYKAKGGGDVAHWLECFGGRSITIDRKTADRKTIYIPRASVCVAGGIQPGTLGRLLTPDFFVSGFAARLFFAYPPKRPKRWTEDEIDPDIDRKVMEVFAALYSLSPQVDIDGTPEPVDVTLAHYAKEMWIKFVDQNGDEQFDRADEQEVAAWSKLEGGTARLALILHQVKVAAGDPTVRDNEIDHVSLQSGINLSRWFGHEAERIYATLREPEEDKEDRLLCEFIRRRGGRITARDLQRSNKTTYSNVDAADRRLMALVDAGHGRWSIPAPTGRPGRPADRQFIVAPAATVEEASL